MGPGPVTTHDGPKQRSCVTSGAHVRAHAAGRHIVGTQLRAFDTECEESFGSRGSLALVLGSEIDPKGPS
jgi:hypothetical protein